MVKAYAKINISLDAIGKRDNGYHDLRMIMQTIDLYDVISLKEICDGIKVICNNSSIPTDKGNLAYKAAELFINTYGIKGGVEISIEKNIPIAAGLAGGSTDAASVLKSMRDIYKPEIEDKELMELGVKIGADVPYCIVGGTALCEGIGEKVTRLTPFTNNILVLIKPPFGVSTKEVYQNLQIDKIKEHPNTEYLIGCIEDSNLNKVAGGMKNVLEGVTLKKHTILDEIKEQSMKMGALGALMSGSGPTVFAFFEDMLKAQRFYDDIEKEYDEVFITRTI